MSRIADVWVPCPSSNAPPGGETPRGISPTGGSEPMSWTQIGAPIAPPPHKTSLLFSYLIPPFPRYFSSHPHLPHALHRFRSTAVPPSSADEKVRPRYRNKYNAVTGVPYSKKTLPICSSVSSKNHLRHFLSVPRRHIAEFGCAQLRASCGTNTSHWGHRGWG